LDEIVGGVREGGRGEGEEGRKCLDVDVKKSREDERVVGRRRRVEERERGIRLARGTRRRGEMSDILTGKVE